MKTIPNMKEMAKWITENEELEMDLEKIQESYLVLVTSRVCKVNIEDVAKEVLSIKKRLHEIDNDADNSR